MPGRFLRTTLTATDSLDRFHVHRRLPRRPRAVARAAAMARAASCAPCPRPSRCRAERVCRSRGASRAPEGRRLHDRAHALRHDRNGLRYGRPACAHAGRRTGRAGELDRLARGGAAVAGSGAHRHGRRAGQRGRPAVRLLADIRHRSEVRLQPDDGEALARRPRQRRGARHRDRPSARRARAVADARRGAAVVAVGLGRVDRVPGSRARAVSDAHCAAVQQVLAAAGRARRASGSKRCWRAADSRAAACS